MRPLSYVLCAAVAASFASVSLASPVPSITLADGNVLNIEGTAGSGQFTSYEVIDFADTGGPSYAWAYEYNTPVSGFQMLQDISAQFPALQIDSTYYPSFDENEINNFTYGSATGNPNDYWRYLNGVYDSTTQTVDWTDAASGADDFTISNGSFDGWYNSFANDNPPALPETSVPEPGIATLGAGLCCLLFRRTRREH